MHETNGINDSGNNPNNTNPNATRNFVHKIVKFILKLVLVPLALVSILLILIGVLVIASGVVIYSIADDLVFSADCIKSKEYAEKRKVSRSVKVSEIRKEIGDIIDK